MPILVSRFTGVSRTDRCEETVDMRRGRVRGATTELYTLSTGELRKEKKHAHAHAQDETRGGHRCAILIVT